MVWYLYVNSKISTVHKQIEKIRRIIEAHSSAASGRLLPPVMWSFFAVILF